MRSNSDRLMEILLGTLGILGIITVLLIIVLLLASIKSVVAPSPVSVDGLPTGIVRFNDEYAEITCWTSSHGGMVCYTWEELGFGQ